jgi:hypothetical protein
MPGQAILQTCTAFITKSVPVVAISTALGSLTGSVFEQLYSQNGAAAGAVASLVYLVLRQWFRERQDLIKSYREDLLKATDERHRMANQMSAQNLMIFMLMKTADAGLVSEMSRIYKNITGAEFEPAKTHTPEKE